ncbi:MAG: hypothetical protein ACJA1L_001602 [Paracoccaceae bacterium]|jgi:hypothetical protein
MRSILRAAVIAATLSMAASAATLDGNSVTLTFQPINDAVGGFVGAGYDLTAGVF